MDCHVKTEELQLLHQEQLVQDKLDVLAYVQLIPTECRSIADRIVRKRNHVNMVPRAKSAKTVDPHQAQSETASASASTATTVTTARMPPHAQEASTRLHAKTEEPSVDPTPTVTVSAQPILMDNQDTLVNIARQSQHVPQEVTEPRTNPALTEELPKE